MKIKGINRNIRPEDLPEGYSLNNKNVVYSEYVTALTNENGFLVHQKKGTADNEKYGIYSVNIGGVNYYLRTIGVIPIDNNANVIFSCGISNVLSVNSGNIRFSEIGILDKDGLYTTILRDEPIYYDKLGFNLNFPINGVFQRNNQQDLIIAFTADNFTPKTINLTHYQNNPPSVSEPFQLNDIELFPSFRDFNCNGYLFNTGGSLITGSHFLVFKYKNKLDEYETNAGIVKNNIIVYDGNYPSTQNGSSPEIRTSKKIEVHLFGLDQSFDTIVMYDIQVINNITTAKRIKEYSITDIQMVFDYTGNEISIEDVSLDSVLVPQTSYTRIHKLEVLNNRLYGMALKQKSINYQPYANNIKVRWVSKLLDLNVPATHDPNQWTDVNKSFQHREVYALYIHLILEGGIISEGFHIPGLEPTGSELNPNPNALANGINLPSYATDDTCTIITNNPTGESTGNCGKWINQNESYPDTDSFNIVDVDSNGNSTIIGDLKNKKVRHHKMPSVGFINTTIQAANFKYGVTQLDQLGFEFYDIKFPKEILPRIKGYFFSYAKRTGSNNLVLGQSFGINAVSTDLPGTSEYPTGVYGSNGVNANLETGSYGAGTSLVTPQRQMVRLYDMNLLKKQLPISNTYLTQEANIVKSIIGIDALTSVDGDTIDGLKAMNLYNMSNWIANTNSYKDLAPNSNIVFRSVTGYGYLQSQTRNIVNGCLFDNRKLEECLIVTLNNTLPINWEGSAFGITKWYIDNGRTLAGMVAGGTGDTGYHVNNYLHSVNRQTDSVYDNFYEQSLVSIGEVSLFPNYTGTSYKTYVGDIYICRYGFHTFGHGARLSYIELEQYNSLAGIRCEYEMVCESVYPTQLRNLVDVNSYFRPARSKYADKISNLWSSILHLAFDESYNRLNEFTPIQPYNPYKVPVTDLQYRIARSAEWSVEGNRNNWKSWLVNDYYEISKNKGKLTNIQATDRNLYIQTEQATFITKGNQQIDTSEGVAYVGSGNIFEVEPQEIISTNLGTIGNTNMWGTVLTEYGLVTIDRRKGQIWLLNGGKPENIGKGLERYFQNNLDYNVNPLIYNNIDSQQIYNGDDNPFQLFGFNTAYDNYNRRIIISKKFYELTEQGEADVNSGKLKFINGRFVWNDGFIPIPFIVLLDNTTYFTNKSFTYSYSFLTGEWISEHDYIPNYMWSNRQQLLSTKDKSINSNYRDIIYKHNNPNNKGLYYNSSIVNIDNLTETSEPYPSYIIPVFNFGRKDSKLFISLQIEAKIYNNNGLYKQQETFNELLAWNDYQCTGDIILNVFDFDNYFNSNIRNIKDAWQFNNLRDKLRGDYLTTSNQPFIINWELNSTTSPIDLNKNFIHIRPLIEKYLAVKLIYNNSIIDNTQRDLHILDVSVKAQPVNR